jgi:hypothetical protein
MGLCDTVKNLSAIIGAQGDEAGLLEALFASAGIEAALLRYDPDSRQVVLALLIHGQTRFVLLPVNKRFSRGEICQVIAAAPTVPADQVPAGQPSAEISAADPQPPPSG